MMGNKKRTWALVMNGARARILRGLDDRDTDGLPELVMKSEGLHVKASLAGGPSRPAPGRGGRHRSRDVRHDPVAEDMRAFARQVIALLECHRRAGELDRLVIYAEHDVLGNLRLSMPMMLRRLVLREVPKNLLLLSEADLRQAITDAMHNAGVTG
ncbi:host attachment protein [bacterium]|nr:host attachment protein [bacterium]